MFLNQDEVTARKCDVSGFIRANYTPYEGDDSFLEGPTEATLKLWAQVEALMKEELKKGILDVDTKVPSTITSHKAGYIQQDLEKIVGVQTDEPFKRGIKPNGGWRITKYALNSYGFDLDPEVEFIYKNFRETHNDAVFACYDAEMRACRSNHILTGLPDGYGRGRIIGDYRRLALYGADQLIAWKKEDFERIGRVTMEEKDISLRHDITLQIRALEAMKKLGEEYGCDVSKPASSAREAVQFTYLAYLAAIKEQDGAAMSFGRPDAFFDVYFERDIAAGILTEKDAQEIIDHFIMKCRMVRQLRAPEYNDLFAGDPQWTTLSIAGMDVTGKTLVTKTTFRLLQSLFNMGPAPEPNMTILWSTELPEGFKIFASKVSVETSSIQFENDDLMRIDFGSDYAIACCVSAMRVGKDMQFFGARCNMAKLLLYALNGGVDEKTGKQVGPNYGKVGDGPLVYEDVLYRYERYMDWLMGVYARTMNVIHWAHDHYNYESAQMALHDTHVRRLIAFGVAGISHVADSLSAIKYAKVTPIRDERGIITDFNIEGDFPCYGNDDDRADSIATWVADETIRRLRQHKTYRDAVHTLSVLTITSNVVYGRATGTTPDGRKAGLPFAPGANPSNNKDSSGAIACLNSVSKIPYEQCGDGISLTMTVMPSTLGKSADERYATLAALLDGYCETTGHHLNVNVFNKETLLDAHQNPEKYPNLTIRVSGYAVKFAVLTKEQREDVLARTFHLKC